MYPFSRPRSGSAWIIDSSVAFFVRKEHRYAYRNQQNVWLKVAASRQSRRYASVRVRVPADPEAAAGKPENTIAADVYADDITNPNSSLDAGATLFLFRIEADPEPDVFARVAAVFNIANIAPRRATLDRESPGTVNISVLIELARAGVAEMLRRKLEQLTCTLSVEVVTGESGWKARTVVSSAPYER